jgi:polysaccharide biosynthesis protein PslG
MRLKIIGVMILAVFSLSFSYFLSSQAQQPSILSKTVPNGLGVNIKSANMTAEECDLIKQAGFKWVRFDLAWNIVEKQKGVYEFAGAEQNYDRLVQNMSDRGIHVLFLLAYGNPLHDSGSAPYTEEGRQAFARYAAASVRHFTGHSVIWEIWNEPNRDEFWRSPPTRSNSSSPEPARAISKSAGWAALANVAIPAMRQADPNAFIIGPALSTLLPEAITFLQEVSSTDALNKLDAISVHPYRDYWPETIGADYAKLNTILKELNLNIPVLDGEMGYTTAMFYGNHGGKGRPSEHGLRQLSLDQQASYLVRLYLTDLYHEVPLTIWYAWPDEGDNPTEYMQNFGVVSTNKQRKPPFYAAQTLTGILNGFEYNSRVSLPNAKDWLLKFTRDRDTAFALWTEEDQQPHAITLERLHGKYDRVGLYGYRTAFEVNRSPEFTITNEPQYLVPHLSE